MDLIVSLVITHQMSSLLIHSVATDDLLICHLSKRLYSIILLLYF